MPRQKDIVRGNMTTAERHAHALKKSIEQYEPYLPIQHKLVGIEGKGWAVVYTAPLGGERSVTLSHMDRATAKDIADLASQCWAEGLWSSSHSSLAE